MGEKKDEIEKMAAVDGGDEPTTTTVVLKLDLHCEGCAKKVRRSIAQLQGVEKVKADCKTKKLNVTGNVDPTWLRDVVQTKTKKKVDLIYPLPQKVDGGAAAGADKKSDDKPADQKKTEEISKADDHHDNNNKPKEAAVSTVVLKTKLHCDECAHKIKRIIFKNFEGVESVTSDLHKDLMRVRGRMEVEKLVTYLREKLKRGVDIITAAPKTEDGKGGEEVAAAKVDVINKMEHHGNYNINSETHYAMPMPMPMSMSMSMSMYNQSHDNEYPISHSNTVVQYGPPVPPPTYLNMDSDHMFSDENPNGCSLM